MFDLNAKPFKWISHCCLLGVAIPMLSWPGCSGEIAEADLEPSAVASEINGTLVASLALAEDHTVHFYDFGNGNIAIRESSSLDSPGGGVLVSLDLEGKTASQIYQTLSAEKGDSAAVPSALREAERLATPIPGFLGNARPAGLADHSVLTPSFPISICSADANRDSYGADWFLDRYCTEGGFRFCKTNITTSVGFADDPRPLRAWLFDSDGVQSSWFKACAMAADFEVSSKFYGGHIEHCPPGTSAGRTECAKDDYSLELRPRRVECWAYTGMGKRYAAAFLTGSCSRTHFAAMRNH